MKKSQDATEYFHLHDIHIPSRTIYAGSKHMLENGEEGGTDYLMAEMLTKNLHILNAISEDPITVILNSPGGDVYRMLSMFDELMASKAHVTIIGSGIIASAAAFIMQAADTRVMRPSARLMVHYGSTPAHDTEWEFLTSVYRDIVLEKMRQKNATLTRAQVHKMLLRDAWFSAAEALELGLIDEVRG